MLSRLKILLPILAMALAALALLSRHWDKKNNIPASGSDPTWAQSTAAVVTAASRAVVAIDAEQPFADTKLTARNVGSGFIIDPAGLILTNEHVIHQASSLRVTLHDQRCLPAVVIAADVRGDLAVLKIDGEGFDSLTFAPRDSLTVGQPVIALGNPMGTAGDGKAVATFGLINRFDCSLDAVLDPANDRFYDNLIQTTALTLPGSSGGPVINTAGQVIGVNTAVGTIVQSEKQFGFAIAIDDFVRRHIDRLKTGQSVPYAFLGAVIADSVDDNSAKQLNISDRSGALVESVMLGFPAQLAGLARGDLIRTIDKKPVLSRHELLCALNRVAPGKSITVDLLRTNPDRPGSHQQLSLTVTLVLRRTADLKGFADEASLDYIRYCGLHIKPLTPWRKDKLQLPPNQFGVLVYDIEPNSPARRQGLAPGCVITHIVNHPITSLDEFQRLTHRYPVLPDLTYIPPTYGF